MNVSLKIALRYIFTKRTFNFITVITFISFLGIMVGVAALIAVMSIFNGFHSITEKQIVGFDPHLKIIPAQGAELADYESKIAKISKISGITDIFPIVEGRVIAVSEGKMQVFALKTLPTDKLTYFNQIGKSTILGKPDIHNSGTPRLFTGAGIADKLYVLPKDSVFLFPPKYLETYLTGMFQPQGKAIIISGIFQTNIKDYDSRYCFTDIETGRELFGLDESSVSALELRISSLKNAEETAKQLQAALGNDIKIQTWKDLNADLYQVMQFERMAAFSILSLIVIIAVFNVFASLSMTVTEKKKDIGALMALGASPRFINKIYIWEGALIGVMSTVCGSLLGMFFVWGQQTFKWFRVDTTKYIIDAIPVSLSIWEVLPVIVFALILSTLAGIYPARRAGKINAIDAIKYE